MSVKQVILDDIDRAYWLLTVSQMGVFASGNPKLFRKIDRLLEDLKEIKDEVETIVEETEDDKTRADKLS